MYTWNALDSRSTSGLESRRVRPTHAEKKIAHDTSQHPFTAVLHYMAYPPLGVNPAFAPAPMNQSKQNNRQQNTAPAATYRCVWTAEGSRLTPGTLASHALLQSAGQRCARPGCSDPGWKGAWERCHSRGSPWGRGGSFSAQLTLLSPLRVVRGCCALDGLERAVGRVHVSSQVAIAPQRWEQEVHVQGRQVAEG